MATFKQIPQMFLPRKLIEYFTNMVKNYDDECRDSDFFDVIRNCFDHDKAVELIETAYTEKELEEMRKCRSRNMRLDLTDSLDEMFCALWNNPTGKKKCRVILDAILELMKKEYAGKGEDPVENRIMELVRGMKLNTLETELLTLAYVCDQTCFSWPSRLQTRDKPLHFAMALDRSYSEVMRALSPQGTLMKYNLLDDDYDFSRRTLGGYMDGTTDEALDRRFYARDDETDILPWKFYGELAEKHGEVLKRMVQASGGKCNILLYGAPGTGKTSFAHSLARELGRTAFTIRQGDENGENMKASARMVGIQVCNYQESPESSLMIIDEADELLRGSACEFSFFGFSAPGKSTEKGVTNTLLDGMKIPAVWISNAPAEMMDESVRRRFDYSICFERLNIAQRVAIWRNQVEKHGLAAVIPDAKLEAYATKYETSAGGISTVLTNVKRMAPEPEQVDELIATLMKPHCQLMGLRESTSAFLPAKDYSLDGLCIKGKVPLERIVKAAGNYLDADHSEAAEDKPRMNILLFGPPGTGKTEFVKYLGKALDRKVQVMRGSDILSKYVGESEQKIARAFRRAEAQHAILFFDEVDGLLQDRGNASHNWEITQVNELLQQMENFNGIMVAATNFSKNLDPATMRRFTFKLEFDYLDDAGKRAFFERMFKTTLTEEEFAQLHPLRNLTPGDFRTVRQEQFYLGDAVSNLDRIAALKEECALKKDGDSSAAIGF